MISLRLFAASIVRESATAVPTETSPAVRYKQHILNLHFYILEVFSELNIRR